MKDTLIRGKNRSMNRLFLFPVLLILSFSTLSVSFTFAQSWYIKPSSEIPLRRGQGTDYKILAIVPNDTELNIIEDNAPWAKIRTLDGKEGWILKRYLTQEKPLKLLVDTLRSKNTALMENQATTKKENDKLVVLNKKLQQELDGCLANLVDTRQQYQTLTEETSDVIRIKDNLAQSRQTTTRLQQELASVSEENGQLKGRQNIKWFLAGGGTLIFGCLVGILLSKSRKKRSSLY